MDHYLSLGGGGTALIMDKFENAVKTLKLSFLENTHKTHSQTSAYNFRVSSKPEEFKLFLKNHEHRKN